MYLVKMKTIFLIRHAKSSWDEPLEDKFRPISKRGQKDAHLVASHLQLNLAHSFTVWCSISTRTIQTALIFSEYLPLGFDNIHFKEELYTFNVRDLEKSVKKCENSHAILILFGHNEAITKFVNKFGDLYINNVPTSGVVALQFDTDDWNKISNGQTIATLFPSHFKNE